MRVIARRHLLDYARKYPLTGPSLSNWYTVTSAADWKSMNDVTLSFRNAKILNKDRVRFEVSGGNHRMIVSVSFAASICWVEFIGTHKEYDAVDVFGVSLF